MWRHYSCIFGVHDLPILVKLPHLFANKFMPDYDYGAFLCWLEHLHTATYAHDGDLSSLNESAYLQLPHVSGEYFCL